jgi:hypothetical protein
VLLLLFIFSVVAMNKDANEIQITKTPLMVADEENLQGTGKPFLYMF